MAGFGMKIVAALVMAADAMTLSPNLHAQKTSDRDVLQPTEEILAEKNKAKFNPFGGHSKAKKANKKNSSEEGAEKVEISLYYEVLCPYCRQLISTSVAQMYNDTEFKKRIEVKLYPFGNAIAMHKDNVSEGYKFWHKELDAKGFDYVFACQHGNEECFGNTVQACAMDIASSEKQYMPFIFCMESYQEGSSIEKSSYDCAVQTGIDPAELRSCAYESKGNNVMLAMSKATDSLKPPAGPHEYVPWVTLNGEHSQASEMDGEEGRGGNMVKEVCDKLKEPKPSMCEGSNLIRLQARSAASRMSAVAAIAAVVSAVIACM